MANDTPDVRTPSRRRTTSAGVALALTSALAFGLAGSLARALMDAGWSAGAAVAIRVTTAALVLAVPGALALRGRYAVLRANARMVVVYGLLAVAAAQLFYFMAVARLDVGVALLIEYTAPVAVVLWMWLAHDQRPGPLTFAGAAVAATGLVLLLDVVGGATVDLLGVLLSLLAMVGAASYFVISADDESGLPPITLAAGGLVVAAGALWLAAGVGILPLAMTTSPVDFAFGSVAWWVPLLTLGVVTAAVGYVTGIAAARRLGSRLASFVALTEVAAGIGWAWLLVSQVPRPLQLLGAVLVLAGVVVVKLGERDVRSVGPDEGLLVDAITMHHPSPRR